jgi:hypothetical protein
VRWGIEDESVFEAANPHERCDKKVTFVCGEAEQYQQVFVPVCTENVNLI